MAESPKRILAGMAIANLQGAILEILVDIARNLYETYRQLELYQPFRRRLRIDHSPIIFIY